MDWSPLLKMYREQPQGTSLAWLKLLTVSSGQNKTPASCTSGFTKVALQAVDFCMAGLLVE